MLGDYFVMLKQEGCARDQDNIFHFELCVNKVYGKCSKISNTLKLRTPKIIAENNF